MIIPFNNLVLVKEVEKEKKTSAGIIMSDKYIGRYVTYKVLAVGEKVTWIQPGSIVIGNPTPKDEELEDGTKLINSADLFGRVE